MPLKNSAAVGAAEVAVVAAVEAMKTAPTVEDHPMEAEAATLSQHEAAIVVEETEAVVKIAEVLAGRDSNNIGRSEHQSSTKTPSWSCVYIATGRSRIKFCSCVRV